MQKVQLQHCGEWYWMHVVPCECHEPVQMESDAPKVGEVGPLLSPGASKTQWVQPTNYWDRCDPRIQSTNLAHMLARRLTGKVEVQQHTFPHNPSSATKRVKFVSRGLSRDRKCELDECDMTVCASAYLDQSYHASSLPVPLHSMFIFLRDIRKNNPWYSSILYRDYRVVTSNCWYSGNKGAVNVNVNLNSNFWDDKKWIQTQQWQPKTPKISTML